MTKYEIAIPSYRRDKTLKEKTLQYLSSCKINPKLVTVFVADTNEATTYRETIGKEYSIVVAAPGMRAVRNFIQQYYPEGASVFNLDDDLEGIFKRVDDKRTELETELDCFIQSSFDFCLSKNIGLWGINAVLNPFWMKYTTSTDLKYIVGCVWGCINTRNTALAVTLDDKEDYERTIKYYLRDGAVARFNGYAPKTRYYKEPGGMQVERTEKRVQDSALYLVKTYPQLCKLNLTKASGHYEVRLRDSRLKGL